MNEKYNVFYLSKDQSDTMICQYLSLNNFITHLHRQQYYVRRKSLFEDINEKALPMKLLFKPTLAIHDTELSSEEKNYLSKSVEEQSEKLTQYSDVSKSFVSCWTLKIKPDNFMWETYASKFGVCVISTIFNVVASFKNKDFQEYKVYCAPVTYKEPSYNDEPDELSFVKRPLYKSEAELRFLFEPKNKEFLSKENIWLPYEPNVMIDEVVLSPYWSSSTANFLISSVKDIFGLTVRCCK